MVDKYIGLTAKGCAVFQGDNKIAYPLSEEQMLKKLENLKDTDVYKNRDYAEASMQQINDGLLMVKKYNEDHTKDVVQTNIREGERALAQLRGVRPILSP